MSNFIPPIPNFRTDKNISQLFGMNRDFYYSRFGIPAHNGWDLYSTGPRNDYGTPVYAAHDWKKESVQYNFPGSTTGNRIYLRTLDGFHTSAYLHLSKFNPTFLNVNSGKAGDVIAYRGNTGLVSPKPTASNPYGGTHTHFGVRDNRQLNNEYKGYVDPTPFLYTSENRLPFWLDRDLFMGVWGASDEISYLQTLLKLEIPVLTFQPIGIFGNQTRKAVNEVQQLHCLSTYGTGIAGPKTRKVLNTRYSAPEKLGSIEPHDAAGFNDLIFSDPSLYED